MPGTLFRYCGRVVGRVRGSEAESHLRRGQGVPRVQPSRSWRASLRPGDGGSRIRRATPRRLGARRVDGFRVVPTVGIAE